MKQKHNKFRYIIYLILICVIVLVFVYLVRSKGKGDGVVVAKAAIDIGTIIDENNLDDLFEVKKIDKGIIPENAVKDKKYMLGKRIIIKIEDNTIMQKYYVNNPDNEVKKMNNPVIMGLKVSDMSQMVCGTLRKDDLIDISVINSQSDECIDVIRNVLVSECYNSDGTIITDEGCATCITIVVEKNDEQYINEMLHLGELRICKAGGSFE